MITRRGWEAVAGTLAALLIALYSLNLVLELVAVAAFSFVLAEMIAFESAHRGMGPSRFTARRDPGPRRVPADGEVPTTVDIAYRGRAPFRAEVYDVLPDAFDPTHGSSRALTWLVPGATLTLAYSYRPRVRGAYVVGPTMVVARDAFGFCVRTTALRTDRAVTVVPPSIAGRLGRLGVALFTRFQAGLSVRRRGFGTEFRGLRPYQPSDDIRHVAWKRSTLRQLVVREFDQESRQDFVVALDLSGGMRAGLWGRSALDTSVEAAALLTNLIARGGEDRMGFLSYAGGVFQFLGPGRGPGHFRRVVDNLALADHRPGAFSLPDLLLQASRRLRGPTHLFVFSALDGNLAGLRAASANLRAHGHHPYLFVANRGGFYPAPEEAPRTQAMEWALESERGRLRSALAVTRGEGLPSFTFDRRGAGDRVLYAYTQIRAWGWAR